MGAAAAFEPEWYFAFITDHKPFPVVDQELLRLPASKPSVKVVEACATDEKIKIMSIANAMAGDFRGQKLDNGIITPLNRDETIYSTAHIAIGLLVKEVSNNT